MADYQWVKEFKASVIVCDARGTILEMNEAAVAAYASDGGRQLIGSNVLACHPEPSRTQLEQMLATAQPNVYTIEKRGQKKLVYQAPWYAEGRYAGFVEMVLELPATLPHFVRGG